MENFNALLTLSELKTLYSGNPVGICPLYKGSIGIAKEFETTRNPVLLPSLGSKNTIFTNGENMDIIYRRNSFWG